MAEMALGTLLFCANFMDASSKEDVKTLVGILLVN